MESIIEYTENNMNTFAVKEFTAVDSLVLSELSYIRFDNIVPSLTPKKEPVKIGELLKAEFFASMFYKLRETESHRRLLYALAASPRFRNTCLNFYINIFDPVFEKQFSAVTYFLDDKTAYIAYRGTDATFVGWKEDFNMAYKSPVPSQEEGVKYLNEVAGRIPKTNKLRVGGHSKGGNIAVYSAVKCSLTVQNRIMSVFNHDGPGFKDNLFVSPGFLDIKDRIHTTMPEAAVIGMLLQHHEDYLVIKSSRHGIMQHDAFSWNVADDGFCYAQKINNSALVRSKVLHEWLESISDEKRKLIIDALYQIFEKTEYESVLELSEEWQKSAVSILSTIKDIDPEIKKFVKKAINELVQLSVKSIFIQSK